MSLKEYARKRDFKKTAEPGARPERTTEHRYVIQKHAASRLHYDFRLEMDGVLKSWAVPKGMPYAKGEKRLAVQVEDHPVSYIDFEGTIPKGQYGGGTVMVWDRGVFLCDAKAPGKELERGKLHFSLQGKKLKGDWYLARMRDGNNWLIIKGGEDFKPVSKKKDDTSALSGKTMTELGRNGAVWNSNAKPRRTASPPEAWPEKFIEPMKARAMQAPPADKGWIYEIKFDGYRALGFVKQGGARLLSRNEKDLGEKFPEIVDALAELKIKDGIIDGEIVALDQSGVSSFQLLQALEMGQERPPLYFYAFDLLQLNGEDLRGRPLMERKERLEKLLGKKGGSVRYSASLGEDAKSLLKQAEKLGLEGLIGKRKDSTYEAGRRSGAWIKLKLHTEQEFVVGGFTNPEGGRSHFGALLLGIYDRKELKFCGKVGTGFDESSLKKLYSQFQPLARKDCPFVNLPEKRAGRYGAGVTAAEMRRCHWIEPQMVAQVRFAEWTRDEKLRQPVFLGLREDKDADEVVREKTL